MVKSKKSLDTNYQSYCFNMAGCKDFNTSGTNLKPLEQIKNS